MSYPRRSAVTRRFTLGAPRTPSVALGGEAVVFLRSSGPEDAVHALWAIDVASGTERVVLDPRLATSPNYRWELINALPPMRRTKERAEVERFLRAIRDDR